MTNLLKKIVGIRGGLSLLLFFTGNLALAQTFKPNVMILLDSSGSMDDQITALAAYVSTYTYPNAGYTATVVYQKEGGGTYVQYAADIASVSSAPAQNVLTKYGFWFGTIGSPDQIKLFVGNYLNYQVCSDGPPYCLVSQTKMSIAQRVITQTVSILDTTRWGLMKFINNNTNNPPGGGGVVSQIGVSTNSIALGVSTIAAGGFTPLGEQLRDSGTYYKGQLTQGSTTFPNPIQDRCQKNSVFILSDGLQNGQVDVSSQATVEYTTDHHTTLTGVQNVIVNTIGFSVDPADRNQSLTNLQQAASNGGGSFFIADNTNELEQALFSLPPGVVVTSPQNNSLNLSGTVVLTAGVPNTQCTAGITFRVDGSTIGFEDTVAPYTLNWNSNSVLNGTHTITALLRDSNNNISVSYPILIQTNNDQTAPIINNVNTQVGITTATITWTTNEAADTQMAYGLTSAYTSTTPLNASMVTSHSVALSGLSPGTVYHYQVLSRDAAGNLATLGDFQFTTQSIVVVGPLDHFNITFLNAGVTQSGPGSRNGGHPFNLYAGDCFAATIEAVDSSNNHANFNGAISLGQYLLDATGLEIALAPGISQNGSDYGRLGVSSMDFTMVNGFVFLGSQTDLTKQLCFYRGTRAPLDDKQDGDPGDLHIKVIQTGVPTVNGTSSGYVVWHGPANKMALVLPTQSLTPATTTGVFGSIQTQPQGKPFTVQAYLTDRFWNQILNNSGDTFRFSSSLPLYTGFNPLERASAGGTLVSTVTASTCAVSVTLAVQDITSPIIASTQQVVNMQGCTGPPPPGPDTEKGFFTLSIPGLVTAGTVFSSTITVENVNIPTGAGSVRYAGRLVPLIPLDATHFTSANGTLGQPAFEFFIPEGTNGNFTFLIPNQTYTRAETIWVQLIGEDPLELLDASSMAGPMQVLPGSPTRLSAVPSPGVVRALSASVITITLTDDFGNGIASQNISAQLTQGSGNINVGGVPSTFVQTITDALGKATVNFTSGNISEIDKILVWAPSLPSIPSVEVSINVSLLGDKVVAAYPSPVKITQRPLSIEYKLDQDSDVEVLITDVFGQEVWKTTYPPGSAGGASGFNVVKWDGRNG
ncbi:MAG: hypothetical protein HY399_03995, partial [Elusimicrobia bacterium]|nr:hypothetical protein [Elusimicrobiota bacterium]